MTLIDDLANIEAAAEFSAIPRRQKLESLLRRTEADVPVEQDLSLGSQVHWRPDGPLHRWVRYREAYSPTLLTSLSLGQRVLDPFSGSGSIMIGAAQTGRTSTGIDLNPLATFTTSVKLTPLRDYDYRCIRQFSDEVEQVASSADPWPTPDLSIAGKAFEPAILRAQQETRRAIDDRFGDSPAGRFVLLAWIAIFERVGSFYKEGNGIKYRNKLRRPGTYTNRVEGEWQRKRFGEDQRSHYFSELRAQLAMMLEDTEVWRDGGWGQQRVIAASANEIDQFIEPGSQDSVIFSPPYANRFDYFESYKVELWFGGFVTSSSEMTGLRKKSMRSHLGADLRTVSSPNEALEEFVDLMDTETSAWRMGVPMLMRGYFEDLRDVLSQSARALAPGGRCFVVVGNSAFSGVIFPVDVLAARMARECGFSKATVVTTRHLTVAPQQRVSLVGLEAYMRESIVVLEL
ncbi:MAG: hypothetical protein ACKVOG_07680 [Rhodoglobus sp.]